VLLSALIAAPNLARGGPRQGDSTGPVAKKSQDNPANAPVDASAYAGAETCSACHADIYALYQMTPHMRTLKDPRGPAKQGCEACHGPGAAHAQDPSKPMFAFQTGTPAEKSARCLTCHDTGKNHQAFKSAEHSLLGVSCIDCHDPHLGSPDPKGSEQLSTAQANFFHVPKLADQNRWLRDSLLRKSQPELCFTCHRTIQASFALPSHHRVPEGLMKCTDCHEPHGTENRAQLSKASWESCVGCHIEKRGPFVYEHASVKVDGCVACHNPHGSVNQHLLLRGEGRFLCLQCHVDPSAPNVPHGRLGFQTGGDCVRCHSRVHGSNSSEFFLN
jgi:predicted CXXCH cytochrome family protein